MKWSMRRAIAFLVVATLLGGVVLELALAQAPVQKAIPALQQQEGPQKAGGGPGTTPPAAPPELGDHPGATLPTDPRLRRKLEAVEDYIIRTQDWAQVARTIQELLDLPEDVFVPVKRKDETGQQVTTPLGIREAATRLLGTLPRNRPGEGLDVYNTLHGANARRLLQDALAKGDVQLFADVAYRYLYTDAGPEACERLGAILLDRGDFTAAARAYERLIDRDGLESLEPITLFKATLAFHRSGDQERRERVRRFLNTRAPDGIRLDQSVLALDDLDRLLTGYRTTSLSAYDYPQFGGNETRTAQVVGGAPFMDPRWTKPLTDVGQVRTWIFDGPTSVTAMLGNRNQAVMPAFYPIAATVKRARDGQAHPVVIYRTYAGVSARAIKTGDVIWDSTSPSISMDTLARGGSMNAAFTTWVNYFKNSGQPGSGLQGAKPEILLENSTLGSLSTDGERVYAIEDLPIPPQYQTPYDARMGMGGGGVGVLGGIPIDLKDAAEHNKLIAYGLGSGKVIWELGGRRPSSEQDRKDPRDCRDSYFLGPPLCLGGRLYLLTEKQQELRLVCLDPSRIVRDTDQDKRDAILWVQTLCTAKTKMLEDYIRRTTATHIAFGEGVLVCPTNAGVLLGVDVLSHSLVWAHPYRKAPPAPAPTTPPTQPPGVRFPINRFGTMPMAQPITRSDWKASAPVIADGRVIFTAPDTGKVHCLKLRDGAELWAVDRSEDDVYLGGVFSGRVVLVGKRFVRSVSLQEGKELWRVETGMPSGRGVASENVYYLPVKEFPFADRNNAKSPGVLAIDVEKGRIVGQTRSRPGTTPGSPTPPGNLVFFDGDVVAQSASEISVYPQLSAKLRMMDQLLAQNPRDPRGLIERGELRLDQGNRLGAVEDLRTALANNPPTEEVSRARGKLFEALTELLQRDFPQGKPFLSDYEALCRVEIDPKADAATQDLQKARGQQRRARYLDLFARGMEGEKNFTAAFHAYLELGTIPTEDKLRLDDEPLQAPPDIWARGRIASLLQTSSKEQRDVLEQIIVARAAEAHKSPDPTRLRQFVALFGTSLPIGREARLTLAERLGEIEGPTHLLEAERQLLLLEVEAPDRPTAARAVDSLARLMTRQRMYESAGHYYRILRDRYGDVPVRENKTGAQLHADLAGDPRFWSYLEEPAPPRHRHVIPAEEMGSFPLSPQSQSFTCDPVGDVLPLFRRQRISVTIGSTPQLEIRDRRERDDRKRWVEPLRGNNLSSYLSLFANQPSFPGAQRMGYQAVGHLLLVHLGQSLLAVDPFARKVLWERSLFGTEAGIPGGSNTLTLDPVDGTLQVAFPDGYYYTVGQTAAVGPSYVCLQTRERLTALEPLTGQTLWTRGDMPTCCRVFGDHEYIFVVELDVKRDDKRWALSTRGFRGRDGATLSINNFATHFNQRLRIQGRNLLISEETPKGRTLRLYDVLTGKDVWSATYPMGSTVLRSEDTSLTGVLTPEGKAIVLNANTGKEVVVGIMDAKDAQNLQSAYLLADGDLVYVLPNQNNPNQNIPANAMPNLQTTFGLRGLLVNGNIYAFERRTSNIRWIAEVKSQQLVLEQWREMPVLLFTGRSLPVQQVQGGGRFIANNNVPVASVQAIIKANGKVAFERERMARPEQFHAVVNDVAAGRIEMISPSYKITLSVSDLPPTRDTKSSTGSGG